MASGKPDYPQMSDGVAGRIKAGLNTFHTDMSKAGEAESVKFTGVGPAGLDNYELKTDTSTVWFGVYLGTDGKIVADFGLP